MRPSAAGLCARGDDVGDLADQRRLAGAASLAVDLDPHRVAAGGGGRCRRSAAASSPRTARSGARRASPSRIASMSSAKPMSSISSASSSTTTRELVELQACRARCGRARGRAWRRRRRRRARSARSWRPIGCAAVDRQHARAELAAVAVDRLGDLHRRARGSGTSTSADRRACRRRRGEPLQQRQRERRGLAGAGRRLAEQVAARRAAAGSPRAGSASAPRSRAPTAPAAARAAARGRRRSCPARSCLVCPSDPSFPRTRTARRRPRDRLDAVTDDLCFRPATELAAMLRAREVSARELLDAHLDRIERVNPAVNASSPSTPTARGPPPTPPTRALAAGEPSARCTGCRSRTRTPTPPAACGRRGARRCSPTPCRRATS